MAPTGNVRAYAPPDRDGVIALWRDVFPDDPPRNEPASMLDRKVAADDGLIWVAEADGAVVGAVMAGYDGVRGWLYHLAVSPDARLGGLGRTLVEAAVAELTARGCPKVNLQVRESNAGVKAFYERLGFDIEPNAALGMALGSSADSAGRAVEPQPTSRPRRLVTSGIVFNASSASHIECYRNHDAFGLQANPQGFRDLARLFSEFAALSEHSIDFVNLSPSLQLEPGSVELRVGTFAPAAEHSAALGELKRGPAKT